MGMHTAPRPVATTGLARRGLFTAAAALALVGAPAGTALADEHAAGAPEPCEIPVVDPTVTAGEEAVNQATGDATAPVFEAGTEATAPVHDAVCPPARDLLGQVPTPA
ncbi:hypothetical protein [Actinomycetospora cinnamomea]|uniref:Secreted protein n=1 Tax=Actinomycetospora cinnamomea TaxID=663609 RepID=A0A2U1EVF7_9PSEU|nr:hypothetical protein [Actinomycetospora cinnamomea]PVZ03907.1 hypothetical protein C8D89_11916 [Actinomycetospora cinnamomea]